MLKKLLPILALTAGMLLAGCTGKGGQSGSSQGGSQGGSSGGAAGEHTVVFDFSDSGQRGATSATSEVWQEDEVTFKFEKNSSTATEYTTHYTSLRIYKGYLITISVTGGTIKSASFETWGTVTYSSSGDTKYYDFAGTEAVTGGSMVVGDKSAEVTANAGVSEITINNSVRQVRVDKLTVVYTL